VITAATMQTLAVIIRGQWRPGIGDPTIMGWLTVAVYLTTACLCGIYACRPYGLSANASLRQHRAFWLSLTVVMLFLGINKQLDLQSWFTQIGRQLARSQGWYSERHIVQIWFTIGMAVVGFLVLASLWWIFRRTLRSHGLALFGLVFVVTFVVMRAASFHHFEEILGWRLAHYRMNNVLEIGGTTCVGIAALIGILRRAKTNVKSGRP